MHDNTVSGINPGIRSHCKPVESSKITIILTNGEGERKVEGL